MAKTVFDVLLDKIQEDIESAKAHLAAGNPSTMEQYREVCGLIRGFQAAQMHIHDLKLHMEDDDE